MYFGTGKFLSTGLLVLSDTRGQDVINLWGLYSCTLMRSPAGHVISKVWSVSQ